MKKLKDTNGKIIKDGDELELLGTNRYNGTVNTIDGVLHLETAFFNKPLFEHLDAIDLQYCFIVDKDMTNHLPFGI